MELVRLLTKSNQSQEKTLSLTWNTKSTFLRGAYQVQSVPFLSQKIRSSLMWDKVFVLLLLQEQIITTNVLGRKEHFTVSFLVENTNVANEPPFHHSTCVKKRS